MELSFWPRLVLAVLATWRITHLLANEDGPAEIIVRLRAALGNGFLGSLMDCFQCLSLWVAAPMALLLIDTPTDWLLAWLGLSGAACLIERVTQEAPSSQPTTYPIQGEDHGMLWTQTGRDEAPQSGDLHGTRHSAGPERTADQLGTEPPTDT